MQEVILLRCNHCREPKSAGELLHYKNGKPRPCCKACARAYAAQWRTSALIRAKQQVHRRKHNLAQFGLSDADYEALLAAQGGGCAICKSECATGRRLAVDHDHSSGKVRALLCFVCNTRVGLVETRTRNYRDYEESVASYLAVYGAGNPLLAAGSGEGPLPKPVRAPKRGHSNGRGNYRLTAEQVAEVLRRFEDGSATRRELAREYGVAHTTIGRIVSGDAWRTFQAAQSF